MAEDKKRLEPDERTLLSATSDDPVQMIEEDRRTVEAFLDLLAADIESYPERPRALDPALVASMRELLAGVEVNLGIPLPQEDEEKVASVRQGLAEIAAGLGASVTEDDSFFADLHREARKLVALRQALVEGEESGYAVGQAMWAPFFSPESTLALFGLDAGGRWPSSAAAAAPSLWRRPESPGEWCTPSTSQLPVRNCFRRR